MEARNVMYHAVRAAAAAAAATIVVCGSVRADVIEIGPHRAYARIEDAFAHAKPGDTLRIHPREQNGAYERVALFIGTPRLTFQGVAGPDGARPRIDGRGFSYSGAGSTPRAVFQFNAEASGGIVQGLDISGARNDSYNGAAVRIVAANDVTVRDCDIHDNDMGLMSNGNARSGTCANLRVLYSRIHHNGAKKDPGQNHNLYVGGTSVILIGCEIDHSITGHNFKSRAHFNWIEACYLHDSSNREMDLVDDAANTAAPDSHTVVIGTLIVKAREMEGNRTVIHFGQDGGNGHNGTLFLVHDTIVTPYLSPVVDLDAPQAQVRMTNCLIWDGGERQQGQILVNLSRGAKADGVQGDHNAVFGSFAPPAGSVFVRSISGKPGDSLLFAALEKGDCRLKNGPADIAAGGLPWRQIALPDPAHPHLFQAVSHVRQYAPGLRTKDRADGAAPAVGAGSAL